MTAKANKENLETEKQIVSVWLIPTETDAEGLAATVKDLSDKYQAPVFTPHLTLYSTEVPADQVDQVSRLVEEVAEGMQPLKLDVSGARHTEELFRSVFLELGESPEITALYAALRERLGEYGGYNLKPHLSLLYQENMDPRVREGILNQLSIPSGVNFDRLGIVVHGSHDDYGKDVGKWKLNILAKEQMEISPRTYLAIQIAREAGEALLPKKGDITISKEGVSNVVTGGDIRSERVILKRIARNYPGEQILSEESQQKIENPLKLEHLWVVDPLDGSKNQSDGLPIVCVSIAYVERGEVKVGVIYNPYTKQLYYAEREKGAHYEGPLFVGSSEIVRQRISVLKQQDLAKASLETSISYNPDQTINHQIIQLALYLNGITPRFRQIGSSVEQLARVARGQSDLHFHTGLKPWDYAAGMLLVQEAGGLNLGLDGRQVTFMDPDIVSGNDKLVEMFIEAIQEVRGNQTLKEKFSKRVDEFSIR